MANHTTEVYESIKNKIHKGEYSPAQSLREQDLANYYSVSRSTIKKCLLLLEKEGLVTIEMNKGAKVRSYSLEEVLEYLELRANLEGFIIRRAVPAFSEEQISKLGETLQLMKKHYDNNNLVDYSKCNQIFHQIIYEACPNRTAVDLTINLKNQMRKYNTKTILIPGRSSQSYAEHSAIFEAVKGRDDELAEALMLRHVNSVRRIFKENYSLLF
jgi:DNA-binding GntR family transcriptional regulator